MQGLFKRAVEKVFKKSVYRDVIQWRRLREKYKSVTGIPKWIVSIKYENVCYRNMASIPINAQIGSVEFPHGLTGIHVSRGGG